MARAGRQGLENTFAKQTAKVYASLRGRHAAKLKGNRIIRPAIEMPFDLEQFRRWVLARFAGNVQNIIHCAYCNTLMDVGSFSLDHKIPWGRSLDSRFDNLCLCCEQCNECKGDFSEGFYRTLLELLDSAMVHNVVSADEVQKLLSLVRMGWGYRRIAYHGRPNKVKV